MTDVFGSTTETLTKMIPVTVAVGMLHRTRKSMSPRRITVRRRQRAPATTLRKRAYKPKTLKRRTTTRRTVKRGRRK